MLGALRRQEFRSARRIRVVGGAKETGFLVVVVALATTVRSRSGAVVDATAAAAVVAAVLTAPTRFCVVAAMDPRFQHCARQLRRAAQTTGWMHRAVVAAGKGTAKRSQQQLQAQVRSHRQRRQQVTPSAAMVLAMASPCYCVWRRWHPSSVSRAVDATARAVVKEKRHRGRSWRENRTTMKTENAAGKEALQ
jgi:hypothetical protein